mgnify:CR=1 FL=1
MNEADNLDSLSDKFTNKRQTMEMQYLKSTRAEKKFSAIVYLCAE